PPLRPPGHGGVSCLLPGPGRAESATTACGSGEERGGARFRGRVPDTGARTDTTPERGSAMRDSGADGAADPEQGLAARRALPSLSFGTLVFWGALAISLVFVLGFVVGPLTRLVPFLVFLPAIVAGVGTIWQT